MASENEHNTEQETHEEHGVPPVADDSSETQTSLTRRMPTFTQLGVALGILVLVFGVSFFKKDIQDTNRQPAMAETQAIQTPEKPESKTSVFEDVHIEAEAAFVWDIKEQKALYSKNPDAQLPLASLTKLMTALVASEILDKESNVVITSEAIAQEGESFFNEGDRFRFRDILDLTLITSSNDGAYALASAGGAVLASTESSEEAFVQEMNTYAEKIGLTDTYFTNPTGLDEDENISGSYGSARDVAYLMEYLATKYPDILSGTREPEKKIISQSGLVFDAHNTNESLAEIPGIVGSKTGYTTLAGGNLAVVFDVGLNHPVVVSVLGSTHENRFSDVLTLAQAAREHINQ